MTVRFSMPSLPAIVAVLLCLAAAPAAAWAQPSLLLEGDSLAVGAAAPLKQQLTARGWKVAVDAQVGRTTAQGLARLRGRDVLERTLVISLGTNDDPHQAGAFARRARAIVDLAGPRRCVLWLDVARPAQAGARWSVLNGCCATWTVAARTCGCCRGR